jgi:hypothetical protein
MKKLVLVLAVLAACAPAAAGGGGWATVGLGSLPPDDLVAGAEWTVDLTVLQHGRTPLEHVQPVVRLRGPGGATERFAATPTAEAGVYRAVVRFPSSGTWRYEVDDGFSQTHTYRPVTVGAPPTAASFPTLPVGGLAAALVLAALLLVARRQRPRSQPVTARG